MTPTTDSVTLQSSVSLSPQVLVQDVGGEAVLLDLASEQYFGLDPVGARIWALIGEGAQLGSVYERLCREFEADPSRLEQDLLALVDELAGAGLVTVS